MNIEDKKNVLLIIYKVLIIFVFFTFITINITSAMTSIELPLHVVQFQADKDLQLNKFYSYLIFLYRYN